MKLEKLYWQMLNNQLIEDIANETVRPKGPVKIEKNKEDKNTETKSKQ